MIGKKILHYKIIEKLGEGGMGVVYLAEDTKLERKVAIKFLPHYIAINSEERERFKTEAKASAALNHQNIATIYAIEESDDQIFIVMEYIEGKELKFLVDNSNETPLQIKLIIDYAIQLAEGLATAHNSGIVHRDIKSQNIMITNDGKVKIMDFGLAKIKGGTQVTKIGSTIGTAAYMSPEQSKGEEIDHRTDIWSYGVVLYEMLTGELPFKGDYDQAIIYSILNEEPSLRNKFENDFLKKVVKKTLEKDRDKRYRHAANIIEDIQSANVSADDSINKSALKEIKKLAVLPFSNIADDPTTNFLGFALADQIIGSMAYSKSVLLDLQVPFVNIKMKLLI